MPLLCLSLLLSGASLAAWYRHRRGHLAEPYHLDLACLGGLAVAALGFFWRVIWGGSWMPADGGDLASFLYPMYRFIAQSLRGGDLPLWNPHLYGGAPFVGDVQAGLFYPVNVAVALIARPLTYRTMEWLSMFHIWWAGAGMYLLLRLRAWRENRERLSRWASLAGALAFMFSDGFLTHFGNLNLIAVASWLPWVFWAYVRGISSQQPRMSWAVLAGVFLGVATLAGHIQVTLFIALALVVYSLFEFMASEPRRGRKETLWRGLRFVAYLSVCGLVALLLSAVVLLPGLELTSYTARSTWDYQQTVGYSLSPAQWIGLLIPGFFGRGPQFHWGLWPRVEVGYLGVLPVILALLAVLRARPRRMWPLLGLAITAFVLALGIYSVPHGWLATLVPGFGQFRAPARLIVVMDLALAALAALGLDAVVRIREGGQRALQNVAKVTAWAAGATCSIGLPMAYYALITGQDKSPEIYARISVATIAVAIFAALLLASLAFLVARRRRWARPHTLGLVAVMLIFLDLASTGAYSDLGAADPTLTFDHPEIVEFLGGDTDRFRIDARTGIDQLWQPDTALVEGLDDVWGVANPLVLADYERYWEGLGGRSSRLYDFLNARYAIARKDVTLDWDKFELAFDGDPQLNVYRNRDALPRAFLVHQANTVADHEAAWAAVHAPGFDPATAVVLEKGTVLLAPATGPERAEIAEFGSNEIVVEVDATAPGYLVLSEVFYPGWQVVDQDGDRREVLRANYAFRAVAVEQGTSRLRLVYKPTSFRVGAVVSCVTLLALIAMSVKMWRPGSGKVARRVGVGGNKHRVEP